MSDFQWPSTWYCIEVLGARDSVLVDLGTYRELCRLTDAGAEHTVTVDDIYGCEQTIVLDKVSVMSLSSPEIRYKYRMHNQALEDEKQELGPYDPGGDAD